MSFPLVSLSSELAGLVESTSASIVAVHGRPRMHSSGVQWTPDLVITADHALESEDTVAITAGKDRFEAEVLGRDATTDIAVLRLKAERPHTPLALAEVPGALRPGNLVLTVGRNKESANAELSVLSSIGGPAPTRRGGKLDAVLRLSGAIHPVSVGGAVVDLAGNLIGMATPALSRFSVFAVPNATIDRVVRAIVDQGRVPQGYLGAGLQPVAIPEHLRTKLGLHNSAGLMAISVDQNSAAGAAGLLIGDTLLEWNTQPVAHPESLRPLLTDAVGKVTQLKILRGGEILELQVEVRERPRSQA